MLSHSVLALLVLQLSGAVSSGVTENPIRKIVTLLQDMQKEVEAEGEKEQKAFDKFMCYCDGNTDSMQQSASEGTQRGNELASKTEALKAEKAQLDQELVEHKASRETATQDASKASAIRATEREEFEEESVDMARNIEAMKGALVALEKGVALVQVDGLALVQRLVRASPKLDDFESQGMLDLLQGKSSEAAQAMSSGQIIGMLKAMQEEMEGDLASAKEAEASAAAANAELAAAKASEIASATSAIESKTKRSGEVAVEIVQAEDDYEDTMNDVKETQEFLADLGKQCADRKASNGERVINRAEEVAAIGETIKILNGDDALDLFKKTASAPAEGLGFLQKSSHLSRALRAKTYLISLAQKSTSHTTQMSLVASLLRAKSVDFSKVLEMVDGMVQVLQKEQKDDDNQLKFCEGEFFTSAQDQKDTEATLTRLAASIEEMTSSVAALSSEVETLQSEIASLDKAVAAGTEQRKSDHEQFLTAQAENQAAAQILEKARGRMAEFYAPAQFVQVRVATSSVPAPPSETLGAYQKKSGAGNSVLSLLAEMQNDLKRDLTEAKHSEETAQKEYEALMSASQKTRASNAKSITEKESAKSEWAEKIENDKTDQASTQDKLAKLKEYIAGLHAQCDFLVENHGARETARTNEVEGLKNAKAVLSGANFS